MTLSCDFLHADVRFNIQAQLLTFTLYDFVHSYKQKENAWMHLSHFSWLCFLVTGSYQPAATVGRAFKNISYYKQVNTSSESVYESLNNVCHTIPKRFAWDLDHYFGLVNHESKFLTHTRLFGVIIHLCSLTFPSHAMVFIFLNLSFLLYVYVAGISCESRRPRLSFLRF